MRNVRSLNGPATRRNIVREFVVRPGTRVSLLCLQETKVDVRVLLTGSCHARISEEGCQWVLAGNRHSELLTTARFNDSYNYWFCSAVALSISLPCYLIYTLEARFFLGTSLL